VALAASSPHSTERVEQCTGGIKDSTLAIIKR
jgi:hypothetical protein